MDTECIIAFVICGITSLFVYSVTNLDIFGIISIFSVIVVAVGVSADNNHFPDDVYEFLPFNDTRITHIPTHIKPSTCAKKCNKYAIDKWELV